MVGILIVGFIFLTFSNWDFTKCLNWAIQQSIQGPANTCSSDENADSIPPIHLIIQELGMQMARKLCQPSTRLIQINKLKTVLSCAIAASLAKVIKGWKTWKKHTKMVGDVVRLYCLISQDYIFLVNKIHLQRFWREIMKLYVLRCFDWQEISEISSIYIEDYRSVLENA